MKILLTNDDGIGADGMQAAWHALVGAGHDVMVCVSDTMHKPLRVERWRTELRGKC